MFCLSNDGGLRTLAWFAESTLISNRFVATKQKAGKDYVNRFLKRHSEITYAIGLG